MNKAKVVIANFFLLIYSGAIILQGIFFGNIVDIIFSGNVYSLKKYLLFFLITILAGAIAGIFAWNIIIKLTGLKMNNIRNGIFSFDINSNNKYDISDYSTNPELLYQKILVSNWNILSTFYLLLFSIIAMGHINILLMIICFISSCLTLIIPKLFGGKLQSSTNDFSAASKNYQEYVNERLSGKFEVQQFFVTKQVISEHSIKSTALESSRKKLKNLLYTTKIINNLLASFSFFIIIAFGGFFAYMGILSAGNVITMIELMNYTVDPIMTISELIKEKKSCQSIKEKLEKKIFSNEITTQQNVISSLHGISVNNISYSYKDKLIFHNFSFTFEKGKKYLINGESGIGKSTLAKLLAGNITPSSGTISISELEIKSYSQNYKSFVRLVNQNSYLFTLSVSDNISFYRSVEKNKIQEVLNSVNALNIDTEKIVDENISGGERDRLSIARALIDMPGIMIFDEPTASLDLENSEHIMNMICSLNCTVIVISHETSSKIMGMFDQIISL